MNKSDPATLYVLNKTTNSFTKYSRYDVLEKIGEAIMYLPIQAKSITRNVSQVRATKNAVTPSYSVLDDPISIFGCNWKKKIVCGASVAACSAICYASGPVACLACFAELGRSSCIDCL